MYLYRMKRFGFSKVCCLGNKADLDESDILEYLEGDPETKVVCLYIESVKDGRRFRKLAQKMLPRKPLIVLKGGRTEPGRKAASSHTGTMAGRDEIYEAFFKQLGIIRAQSFEDLFDLAQTFACEPLPRGRRIGIISITGAGCVVAADAAAFSELALASYSPKTSKMLQDLFPRWAPIGSPLDIWTAVEKSGFARTYRTSLQAFMEDENIDIVLVVAPAMRSFREEIKEAFSDLKLSKPLFLVLLEGEAEVYEEIASFLRERDLPPPFPDISRAVRCAGILANYAERFGGLRE